MTTATEHSQLSGTLLYYLMMRAEGVQLEHWVWVNGLFISVLEHNYDLTSLTENPTGGNIII